MQMNALEVIQTLLVTPGPVTEAEGISKGDPNAGSSQVGRLAGNFDNPRIDVTTKDRVGAWLMTTVLSFIWLVAGLWVMREPKERAAKLRGAALLGHFDP